MNPGMSWLLLTALAGVALASAVTASAQAPAKPDAPAKSEAPAPAAKPPAKPAAPKAAVVAPRRFVSPEAAMGALVAALRAGDTQGLLAILGSEGRPLVSSGDPVSDRQGRETFLAAYDTAHALVIDRDTTVLRIGEDAWPFPVPLVKAGDRWRFDARRGREEIVARRIGRNEIFAMQTCLAYVDAQREYYAEDRNGDGILEYAQRFASSPGQRDGLYWSTAGDERPSPLGALVVRAYAEGYRRGRSGPMPFHGYFYRILTAQGPDAPDGEYDYVTRGHMIAGFALVAFPAEYGVSGVMTFLVNHDGVVYQKDLGPRTREVALAMRKFNPDSTWTKPEIPEVSIATVSPSPASR